uniref:Uncharacterized protein n=1 Tax=Wuchereria bancrofti TaxID=6293 RepID=A0AAF5Q3J3_WUCBA
MDFGWIYELPILSTIDADFESLMKTKNQRRYEHLKWMVSIIGVAVYLFISILSKYDLEYQLAALLPKVWGK